MFKKVLKSEEMKENHFREIELKLATLTLRGKEWGDPDGKPLLGLHGWLDNAATFDKLAPYLEKFHFVALDWSGHGLSDHRGAGDNYHFVDWIPELFEAADSLGWERFSVIAHSLGAGMSALAAGSIPERIESLVLIEGIGPMSARPKDTPPQMKKAIMERKSFLAKKLKVYPTFEEALSQRANSDYPVSLEEAKLLAKRSIKKVEGGFIFDYPILLRAISLTYLTEEQIGAFLSSITCPVLFVRATDSFLRQYPQIDTRINQVPDIEVFEMSGGHHLHLGSADKIAPKIIDFLTK